MAKKDPNPDEAAWRQALLGVEPVRRRGVDRPLPRPRPAPPAAAQLPVVTAPPPSFEVHTDEDGRVEGYRSGAGPGVLRELDHGRARPAGQLDLHGQRADPAEAALVRFLRARAARGDRVVRVVHGKGRHSEDGMGVLGHRVVDVLTGRAGALVLGFMTTAPEHGGTGATLVRLARRR